MIAIKGNRSYAIIEAEKASYQKQGFDITNDNGDVIEYGVGKTVPYEQYMQLKNENKELRQTLNLSIPPLAQGGIVPPLTGELFIEGDTGKELVVPEKKSKNKNKQVLNGEEGEQEV